MTFKYINQSGFHASVKLFYYFNFFNISSLTNLPPWAAAVQPPRPLNTPLLKYISFFLLKICVDQIRLFRDEAQRFQTRQPNYIYCAFKIQLRANLLPRTSRVSGTCIFFYSWLFTPSPCVKRFAFQQYVFGRLRGLLTKSATNISLNETNSPCPVANLMSALLSLVQWAVGSPNQCQGLTRNGLTSDFMFSLDPVLHTRFDHSISRISFGFLDL